MRRSASTASTLQLQREALRTAASSVPLRFPEQHSEPNIETHRPGGGENNASATNRQDGLCTNIFEVFNMDGVEVLAHITAPSGFQDDRRYLAVAAAVAGFEPCSRLKVYGGYRTLQESRDGWSSNAVEDDSAFGSFSSLSTCQETDATQENPAQKAASEFLKEIPSQMNPAPSIRGRSTVAKNFKDCSRPITWKVKKPKASDANHSFKAPSFRAELAPSIIHAARSPEAHRPRTAPAESFGCKPAASRKRARSESSSFESLGSVVPDSQNKRDSVTLEARLYTTSSSTGSGGWMNDSIPYTALPQPLVIPQTRPTKRQQFGEARNLSNQSETPKPASQQRSRGISLGQAQQNSLASHVFVERTVKSLDSSMMWPPRPQTNLTYPPPPEQRPSSQAHDTAFDSTLPLRSQAESCSKWLFSQTPSLAAQGQPSLRHSPSPPLSSISCLPASVHAPTPPVSHAHYTTRLTSTLRALAARLPLTSFFRPVLVRRDINVLERGYWHLRVPVSSPDPAKREAASGMINDEYSRKSRNRPWTEPEFLEFWHTFARHVQSGGSGWGVSIYRKEEEEEEEEDPDCDMLTHLLDESIGEKGNSNSNSTINLVLKVACWGEILGHVYLVMWVLSNKKTEALQMEWRDGDGEVAVKMGGVPRAGTLGEYGFKGGKGADGVWGIL